MGTSEHTPCRIAHSDNLRAVGAIHDSAARSVLIGLRAQSIARLAQQGIIILEHLIAAVWLQHDNAVTRIRHNLLLRLRHGIGGVIFEDRADHQSPETEKTCLLQIG